jgi:hypothetical protein
LGKHLKGPGASAICTTVRNSWEIEVLETQRMTFFNQYDENQRANQGDADGTLLSNQGDDDESSEDNFLIAMMN